MINKEVASQRRREDHSTELRSTGFGMEYSTGIFPDKLQIGPHLCMLWATKFQYIVFDKTKRNTRPVV